MKNKQINRLLSLLFLGSGTVDFVCCLSEEPKELDYVLDCFSAQDEFLALMAKKTKEAEDERELREVFRVFDKNSRGVIDVRRFSSMFARSMVSFQVADLKMIFKALDPDMPDDEVEQIISEVDEDGSGTVDYEGKCFVFLSLVRFLSSFQQNSTS